jgi:hypothetical protein
MFVRAELLSEPRRFRVVAMVKEEHSRNYFFTRVLKLFFGNSIPPEIVLVLYLFGW